MPISFGTAYDLNDQFREAIEYYNKGIDIILRAGGPDHRDLMQGYTYLSATYKKKNGQLHKAEATFQLAEAIFHKHFPPGHIFHGVLYANGGELYYAMGDYNTAVSLLEKRGGVPPVLPIHLWKATQRGFLCPKCLPTMPTTDSTLQGTTLCFARAS